MVLSYGHFGALSPVPNQPEGVVVRLQLRDRQDVSARYRVEAVYDPAVSMPEIRWGAEVENPSPSTYFVGTIAYPPDAYVQANANVALTVDRLPTAGSVLQVPFPQAGVIDRRRPSAAEAAEAAPPVAQAVSTGQASTVDLPGVGPTPLEVFVAPVSKPEIVPGPAGRPVIVVPLEQLPNLPTMPMRQAVGPRGPDAPIEYTPEEWATYFAFPPHRRIRFSTDPAQGSAQAARGTAQSASPSTDLVVTDGGVYDAEGRRYPTVRSIRTLPTKDEPVKAGLVVPAAAGAGFLVAGPIGAAVAAAAALLTRRK